MQIYRIRHIRRIQVELQSGNVFSFPFQAGFVKLNVYVLELLSCNENKFDGAISVRTFKIF